MAHHRTVLKVNERGVDFREFIEGEKTKGPVYAHLGDSLYPHLGSG